MKLEKQQRTDTTLMTGNTHMKKQWSISLIVLLLLSLIVGVNSIAAQDTQVDIELYPTVDTVITLDGTTINAEGNGVTINGNVATITAAGAYSLSGTLTDGQIVVDTEDEAPVTLILNGVDLTSTTSAPINIKNAEIAAILLADGTENYVSDAVNYIYETPEDDEPNAAVFSDDDLIMYGAGNLTVTANYNDGIASKDSLTILGGTYTVTSVDDGIRGKDYLIVDGANITLNVQGDGLKSDNEDDATVGYIDIVSGTFNLTAGGDAITAQSLLHIADGMFTLTTGGGSNTVIPDDLSAKGLKSAVAMVIDGGTFNISAADDAVHTNDSITINTGTFNIATGDDGVHADETIEINGGTFNITWSYEGIESAVITINGGNIHIVSSDDGINVAGGADGSGFGGRPGGGFGGSSDYNLFINGGYIFVNAEGDGLDANGSITMNGGTVIVNGPTQSGNGTLDYDGSFQINGGTLIGAGSAGMMQAPGTTSTQYSLAVAFNNTLSAGSLVHIENSAGETILTFAPGKTYQSLVFSSPVLVANETYTIYQGGEAIGTVTDGVYTDGTYSNGTSYTSLTLTSIVTQEGGGMGGPGGMGNPGGGPGGMGGPGGRGGGGGR